MNRLLGTFELPIRRATHSRDPLNESSDSNGLEAARDTPPQSGGQAALSRRMRIDPDIRSRSIAGAVLWAFLAAIGAVQQHESAGATLSMPWQYVYLGVTVTMALLCLFVGPRLSERRFRVAEEFVVACGWVASAALVAATGGAYSADIGLFANVVFYCAYFMTPSRAARQVAIGTLAMWAPAVYHFNYMSASGFVPRALVMTAVLWAMAILIARHRQMTQLAELDARRLALTDPLTGVANLHTFAEELQRSVAEASGRDGRLGVAFVDVNGLKAANTVFGPAGGDQLIRRTTQSLLSCSGVDDQVARVGGDEFAVLVAGADAERMRNFESEFAVALTEQRAKGEGPAFDLSASIGTAVYPQDGRTLDDLMRVADERMYDSKAALPRRLPTPGTPGGRSLSDAPTHEGSRIDDLVTGAAPASSIAWLLAAAMIAAGAAFNETAAVHLGLALALSGVCIAVAGAIGLASDERRRSVENLGNALAVLLAVPAIYATGGAATPILPLAFLVVAHAAYALTLRGAALYTVAILAVLIATLAADAQAATFAGVYVIIGEVVVIAGLLRFSRARTDAAGRAALELSRIDALTKLPNRRVFQRSLAEAAEVPRGASAADYDRGGLILADVDNFKTINASGGHKTGDEVLRMIASVLEGAMGDDGMICRIGGDEFAVIVPEGDAPSLMRTAAKARAAIGSVDWNVLCEPKVTLSIGYATWEHVGGWKEIVIAADLALRASKDSGKDVVTVAPCDKQAAARPPRLGPGHALAS
ncbi:MAG: GGDEF domain-containing protein [Thermoleophilaceae bacterium]|nr:GGDEF domain-containing protein [Thermoleophilaceae bacterium]